MPYHAELASSVLMVPPKEFDFNAETGVDNVFQARLDRDVQKAAMAEFHAMQEQLDNAGVGIVSMDYTVGDTATPDAVFPNNWFSTHPDGTVVLYPMATANRRAEVRQALLAETLNQQGFSVRRWLDLRQHTNAVLEGTGALVFAHHKPVAVVTESTRAQQQALDAWETLGLGMPTLRLQSSWQQQPVYHTNVLLSTAPEFVVACEEVLTDATGRSLREAFDGLAFCAITAEQMVSYCGNSLLLKNNRQQPLLVLSTTALSALNHQQKRLLERYAELLPVAIPTIETVGGGSARCMLAELFLPR